MRIFSFQMGPILRVSVGIVSLTIALILAFDAIFDVLPDERRQAAEVRQQVSRAIGNQVVVFLVAGDIEKLQQALEQMTVHDPEIVSIGIRRADGVLLAGSPRHLESWVAPEGGASTLNHIVTPLFVNKGRWGQIEMTFNDLGPLSIWSWIKIPNVLLVLLFSTIGFVSFYFYLKRALQYLDPAQAVPERVRRAFDTLTEAVLILDTKGRIMLVNSSFQRLHPEATDRLDGKFATQLKWLIDSLSEDSPLGEYPWDVVVRSNQSVQGRRLKVMLPNGKTRELMMNCSAISDGSAAVRGCLVSFNDVTELTEANTLLQQTLQELRASQEKVELQNDELKQIAHFDPLTACLNRRALFGQAELLFQDALANESEAICIMSDIDHFKSFNDRYGHAVGDLVIQQVAKTLGRSLRSHDLLGRYGGEEFCVFLFGMGLQAGLEIGERMRASIEKECGPGVRTIEGLRITSSFGVVSIKSGGKTISEMIDQADQALYKAKKAGRNRVMAFDHSAAADEGETQNMPGSVNVGHG